MAERWPAAVRIIKAPFNPRGMSVGGPPTMGGITPLTEYDSGFWTASVQVAALGPGGPVKAFRALRARLGGGANQVLVPVVDKAQTPWPNGVSGTNAGLPFSDGMFFKGGVGFFNPAITVALAADLALRATALTPTVTTAGDISGGEYFSLGDRLYVIREVLDNGDWAIWPPAREAVAAGTRLNFDRPACRMQLATEQGMDLGNAMPWQAADAIDFVEAA